MAIYCLVVVFGASLALMAMWELLDRMLEKRRRDEAPKLVACLLSPPPSSSPSGKKKAKEYCVVCLGEMDGDDGCCVLPACRHVFHRECLTSWFVTGDGDGRNSCPLCRAQVQRPPAGAGIV